MTAVAPNPASAHDPHAAAERSLLRSVAVPAEHGGWGLTLEPVVLGLAVAFSWSGLAIGVGAFVAFVLRTPLKLVLVDRRRNRSLPRTRFAARVVVAEAMMLAVLGGVALAGAGAAWLIPVAVAAPLVGIELWFDIRSRGRRLAPELAGSIGIAAVAASIVVAGGESRSLAVAVWMVVGARALASIPFVRTQIERLRHGSAPLRVADGFQLVGVALAGSAVLVERQVLVGALAVGVLAFVQAVALRRRHVPVAKVIGLRQMAGGLVVAAATAVGVIGAIGTVA